MLLDLRKNILQVLHVDVFVKPARLTGRELNQWNLPFRGLVLSL